MTRLFSTLVVLAVCAGLAFAGNGVTSKKPLAIDNETSLPTPVVSKVATPQLMKGAAVTWVLVDSCPNVYGQGSPGTQALAFDEPTGAIVALHRGLVTGGYSPGSGHLWYNLSTDGGATWPRIADVNAGANTTCRYPSVAISNPTGSSNLSDAILVFGAPNLKIAAGFGAMTYGVDFPLGGNAPVAFDDDGDSSLSSNVALWTEATNTIWSMDGGDGIWNWSTTDFVTINRGIPSAWTYDPNIPNNWGTVRGAGRDGKNYQGYQGRFEGNDTLTVINFGYSLSTDGGATWGAWQTPSPSLNSLAGLGPNYDIVRVATGVSSDMVLDKDGYPHFFAVAVDTTTETYEMIEVFESASGWAVNKIKVGLNGDTKLAYGALDQTSWNVRAAIDAAGEVMSVIWSDAATAAAGDSIADAWFSARTLTGGWSTAENITMTPGLPELILHAAPLLKTNGDGTYTMYISTSTDRDAILDPSDTGVTFLWVASYTFTPSAVEVRELPGLPTVYKVEQNFPNPFNPTTSINYSIPSAGPVMLKVYNAIGQEVATLVNEFQNAGNYNVTFSGAELTSGAYFYRLTAGNFTDVKKMVLMK